MTQQSEIKNTFYEAMMQLDLNTALPLLKEHAFLKFAQHEENSLFQTSLRSHERAIAKIFLSEDATLAQKEGYTQAHQYAENGDLNNLSQLLNQQPNMLEAKDSCGNTPLHLAATHGHIEVVQYLHSMGADLQALNIDNNSPLQLALLFDNHTEKNAAKYIINQLSLEQNGQINLPLSHLDSVNSSTSSQNQEKHITQEEWNNLIQKYHHLYMGYISNTNSKILVSSLLSQAGYNPGHLKNIKIGDAYSMSDMDFSGINFENCQFFGNLQNTKFLGCTIENSEFRHAYVANSAFEKLQIKDSSFIDTYFENVQFNNMALEGSLFSSVQFYNTTSTQSFFDNTFVSHSNLLGLTISEPQTFSVMFDNVVIPSPIAESSVNQFHTIMDTAAPVIGLIGSPYEVLRNGDLGMTAYAPYSRLKQYGAVPVLLDMMKMYKQVDSKKLTKEINDILNTLPKGANIPQYVLSQHGENLDKIKITANEYAKYLDAAWIPGGGDVNPAFYGQKYMDSDWPTHLNYDVREIFEFALIDHMVTHNKPLLGICHGSQITNVYFGGTLKQDVHGHGDDHLIMPLDNANTGAVSDIIHKPMYGVSAHHQSIDILGKGLHPVAVSGPAFSEFGESLDYQKEIQTIIEASEGVDGKPIMLLQFHPEYNLDNTNKELLLNFVDLAKQYKQAHALEVNDILTSNQSLFPDVQASQPIEQIDQLTSIYVPELNLLLEMYNVSQVA